MRGEHLFSQCFRNYRFIKFININLTAAVTTEYGGQYGV
jgi:hypothetical protein